MNRLRAGFFVAAAVNIGFMVGIDETIGPADAAVGAAPISAPGLAMATCWGPA